MKNLTPHVVDDVLTWTKTLAIDLPLASTQWVFGTGEEETATTTAWQGYDAGVRVLTAVVDSLYRAPLSGTVLDRAAAFFLRWQYVSHAMTDAAFSRLWHTIGISTAGEIQALEKAIAHLATEIREQRETQEALFQLAVRLPSATETAEHTSIPGFRFRGYAAPHRRALLTMKRTVHQKEG